MILNEIKYKELMDVFVVTYLRQKDLLEHGAKDDCEMTEAVLQYMQASRELMDFVTGNFGEEEPELPRMEVFFSKESGTYHDFAYRMYRAVANTSQLHENDRWRNMTMVYIGEQLRNSLMEECV